MWPATFYGTEALALSRQEVHSLRTSASRALFGPTRATCPYLALHAVGPGLWDPEVYLLVNALRTLRRAFAQAPTMAASILHLICQPPATTRDLTGPAAALRALLSRNSWTAHVDGTLNGPGHHRISLRNSSAREIACQVNEAWAHAVHDHMQHRNGLTGCPVPNGTAAAKLLAKFKGSSQAWLARYIAGAFASPAAKGVWLPEVARLCAHCGQLATKAHRLLQCPKFEAVRLPYLPVLPGCFYIPALDTRCLHQPLP
mgnify:CR=1 FL=1